MVSSADLISRIYIDSVITDKAGDMCILESIAARTSQSIYTLYIRAVR